MADWTNPPDLPPLYESYTGVNPAPLAEAEWGYSTMNLTRDVIYLHLLETPYGKTGMPDEATLTAGPVLCGVKSVVCMNTGESLEFVQQSGTIKITTEGLTADPVDTIIKIELDGPHPDVPAPETPAGSSGASRQSGVAQAVQVAQPGLHALASRQRHELRPLRERRAGRKRVPAAAANGRGPTRSDLEETRRLGRVVIHFARGYPTDFEVLLSADGGEWTSIHRGRGTPHSPQ